MGKSRKAKDDTKGSGRRNFSAYNASNYLISNATTTYGEESSPSPNIGVSDEEGDEAEGGTASSPSTTERTIVDKHELYQRAVQKPKGDISFLHKFFLNYVGGRTPLHLREDFCGTALICAEWVRGDTRRTAVGLDLDEEALHWGLKNNVINEGSDACDRVGLFCGDVIDPLSKARVIKVKADLSKFHHQTAAKGPDDVEEEGENDNDVSASNEWTGSPSEQNATEEEERPARSLRERCTADIICAFNYSCCCLRKRADLLQYFSEAFRSISEAGGVFVMDLYGGSSSECPLKLRRRFDDFQYTWEQEDFDVISRTTRISLHFRPNNRKQSVLRHAFSYHWRLWTLPEVRECLEEAGFHAVHFWIKEMPDLEGGSNSDRRQEEAADAMSATYEEADQFLQADAWNAYVVAVVRPTSSSAAK